MSTSHDPVIISRENNELLQEIVRLIKGDGPELPGILARLNIIERVLFGRENSGGLVTQVAEMRKWRAWVLATLSAAGGVGLTLLGQYIAKHYHLI